MVRATVVVRVSVPEVAVIVTVAAPSVAVLDAVKVAATEFPVVAADGLKATVTPVGRPVALIVTAPVKLVRVIAIVDAPLAPRATDSEPGDAATVKVGVDPSFTVSDTDVVRVSAPEVAVRVTVAAPSVAVLDAVNVAVTELPVVAADGLNATVTPDGSPVALIVTAPVKLVRAIATVVEAVAPRVTETAPGEGVTVKSWVTVVVVALTAALAAETFAVASTARTVYE
jgi:hypothetical protein